MEVKYVSEEEGKRGERRGPKYKSGPGGLCVCPKCGTTKTHKAGVPCSQEVCLECGMTMIRE